MKRLAIVSLAGLFTLSCQGDTGGPLDPREQEPLFEIQDGHTDAGRPGVYWLAPIRPVSSYRPPRDEPFDADLNLTIEICEWSGGCVGPVWGFSTGASFSDWLRGRGIGVFPTLEEYSLLWSTSGLNLDANKTYRIRALVGERELAFADVDVVKRLQDLARVDRDEYTPLLRNGILPIRLRVNEGALCDPESAACASETIDVTEGGTIPLVEDGTTVAVVTVEPTTGQEGNLTTITLSACETPGGDLSSLVDIPVFGDCVEITADPPLSLAIPATASLCAAPQDAMDAGLTDDEIDRMTVHRASLDESETFSVVALAHGEGNCPEPIGMNRFDQALRFARHVIEAARDRVVAMVSPALAWACHRGGCGSPTKFESAFQVGRPSQMNYGDESPSDGNFGALPAGTTVTAQVVVTDLGGDLVEGATLHAAVTSGDGSVTPALDTTTSDGIAEFQFTIGSGSSVLAVSGACVGVHPDAGGSGPFAPGLEEDTTVACGTGTLEFTAEAVTLVGAALIVPDDTIRLTPDSTFKVGAAWLQDRKAVAGGFTATFSFRIFDTGGFPTVDPTGNDGADGLAFVIQDQQPAAIGNYGGGMGYDGIPRSLGVEFDTWLNTEGTVDDPNGNHVSVHTKGIAPNSFDEAASLGSASAGVTLSDGAVHSAVIAYVPGTLTVKVDGTLALTVPVTLTNIAGNSILDGGGRAWVGFTGATGAAFEKHDIFDVKIQIP
jgi:hypothetical protein